ncbi:MAG: V-type ATP synthase subunit D [candidate division WOR-3 bacterium]
MKLAVGASRMSLLRLRRRLIIARRGHKLLKDKQEELMRQILTLIDDIRTHRQKVESELFAALVRFRLAQNTFDPKYVESALILPKREINLTIRTKNILNVKVPVLEKIMTGDIRCYGFLGTSGELDFALQSLNNLLDSLLLLAEKEKTLELLADEMEKTRRRVNALEFILIPNIEETIKFIVLKLTETERSDLTRLMRVKELIRG